MVLYSYTYACDIYYVFIINAFYVFILFYRGHYLDQ